MVGRNSFFAAASACAALCGTTADAQMPAPGLALGWPTNGRPVTGKDLAGKKICWDNGQWTAFGADGRLSNTRTDHGHWVVSEPGTVRFGNGKYIQYLILPDGSFYTHWYKCCLSITGHKEHWGKVCS
jgi:hypothetical protein